jgi:hypothetical protein
MALSGMKEKYCFSYLDATKKGMTCFTILFQFEQHLITFYLQDLEEMKAHIIIYKYISNKLKNMN